MARKKTPRPGRYVVLQETGENRYAPLGPAFDGFEDFAAADTAAKMRRDRYPHQAFVVAQCIARYCHVNRPVVANLVEAPAQPAQVDVVPFPRPVASIVR